MSYSKNNEIYYFLIANNSSKKEIGEYICEIGNDNNNINFNIIKTRVKEILSSKNVKLEKTNKINFLEYNMYYKITNTDIFYLIVINQNSNFINQENLIFELIDDIDHQGIKKLVDKNGELTNVGKQNLKFSIENYVESINKKDNNFFKNIFEANIKKENNNQNELINDDNDNNVKLIEKDNTNKNSGINLIEDNFDDNDEARNRINNIEEDEFFQYENSNNYTQYYNMRNKIIIVCIIILVILFVYNIIDYFKSN